MHTWVVCYWYRYSVFPFCFVLSELRSPACTELGRLYELQLSPACQDAELVFIGRRETLHEEFMRDGLTISDLTGRFRLLSSRMGFRPDTLETCRFSDQHSRAEVQIFYECARSW